MSSPLERSIRDHVGRYLAGALSLQEFDLWFLSATIDIEQRNDPTAEDITWEIMLRLAEYSNGHWTEAELKDLLGPIATPTSAGVGSL